MKSHLPLIAVLLLGSATFGQNVFGQTIYKCGSAYSQSPCPGGVMVDTNDSRSPAQKAQADATAAQTAKSADKMEKERLALEQAQAGKPPKKPLKTDQAASAKKPNDITSNSLKKKKKAPEYFTAAVAPDPKKKKKAAKEPDDKAPVANTNKAVKP